MGFAGLVIAGLFAASMSSLDSSINSMSTALTTDFYRRFKPGVDDRHCLKLARTLTVILGIFGTGAALYMALSQSKSMWDQYIKVIGLFGGGLAGLFAVGIFTRKANGPGVLVGFFTGAVILFVVQLTGAVHFFLYAATGILSCAIVGWLASWLIPAAPKDLRGLTFSTLRDAEEAANGSTSSKPTSSDKP
jgi:Na+/proline symporter